MVPPLEADRPMAGEIERVASGIRTGAFDLEAAV
jgi:hypothetical protein